MAFWSKWFQRARDEPTTIPVGRITQPFMGRYGTLSPYRSRVTDVLAQLRQYRDEAEAIDFLRKVTPDVSMAVWNFLRLSNQGHEMHFYDLKERNRRLTRAEAKWRDFAQRVNEISNSGLDGLLDQLHASAFLRGAMGLEAEVNSERTDIVDLYPVVPQTITWELEERSGRKVWIPYQRQFTKKVSLEKGKANFFWVPTDPDIDDPRGNLLLTPVLQAIDFQLQILQDLQAVLHHQGWPRNDISIALEKVQLLMPPAVKMNPEKQRQWLEQKFNDIVRGLESLEPDSDYIHFDDVTITMAPGANAGRSLDIRALQEMLDTQTLSGTKQLSVFMNRNTGVTETWGTVQFRIFASGLASVQRGSKRLMEQVAALWLRVNGIQGIPVFTHNTIDWNSEEQRMRVRLMEEQFYAIAQLMGWVGADKAASEVLDETEAASDTPSEAIRVSFDIGGGNPFDAPDYGQSGLCLPNNVLPMRRARGLR